MSTAIQLTADFENYLTQTHQSDTKAVSIFDMLVSFLKKYHLTPSFVPQPLFELFSKKQRNVRTQIKLIKSYLIKNNALKDKKTYKLNKRARKSIKHYIGAFIEYYALSGRAESTVERYRGYLGGFQKYLKEHSITKIYHIDKYVLLNYSAFLFNAVNEDGTKKYSSRTHSIYLTGVRLFFRYLSRSAIIVHNPALFLRLPKEERKITMNYMTLKELKQFFVNFPLETTVEVRDKVIMILMYAFGLRIQELCNICIRHINFDDGLLKIEQGKGKKDRILPMPSETIKALQFYLDTIRPLLKTRRSKDVLFLSTITGAKVTRGNLQLNYKIYQRKTGIKKNLTLHSFRYSIATHLTGNGLDLRYVQEFLGHEKPDTTARYAKVSIENMRKILKEYHPQERKIAER